MIPTLLVLGFILAAALGKRALWLLPIAALGWALVVTDASAAEAMLVGGINTLVGMCVGLVVRWPVVAVAR